MLLLSTQCSKHLGGKGSTQLTLYLLCPQPPIQAAYLIPTIRNSHSQRTPNAILLLIPSSTKRITTTSHRDNIYLPQPPPSPLPAASNPCSLPRSMFLPVDFYKLHTSVLPRLEAGSVYYILVDKCGLDRCNGNGCKRGWRGRGSECVILLSTDLVGLCVKMGC